MSRGYPGEIKRKNRQDPSLHGFLFYAGRQGRLVYITGLQPDGNGFGTEEACTSQLSHTCLFLEVTNAMTSLSLSLSCSERTALTHTYSPPRDCPYHQRSLLLSLALPGSSYLINSRPSKSQLIHRSYPSPSHPATPAQTLFFPTRPPRRSLPA